jgi:hypothetical protein
VARSQQSDHCVSMAKTWVPIDDKKSQKAFEKAMRALNSPKGRGRPPMRPR